MRNMNPWTNVNQIIGCIPWIDISNEVWFVSNRDHMPKLHPREIETAIYPNGAHIYGASSPRVRVLDV